MAAGTCKFCGCTEEKACDGGCGWADGEAREFCTQCLRGEGHAVMMLTLLSKIFPSVPFTTPETFAQFPFKDQQLLIIGARATLEAVPTPQEEDFEYLFNECRALTGELQARFPDYMRDANERELSLLDTVVGLIDGTDRKVVLT